MVASSSQQVTFNRSHLTLEASSTQLVTSFFRSPLISCLKHRAHRARITFTGGASSSQQVTSDFGGVIDSTGHIPFPVTTDFLYETQGTQGTNHIHRWRVIATQQVTSDFLEASSTQQVTSLFRSPLISCLKPRAHRARITFTGARHRDSTGHI